MRRHLPRGAGDLVPELPQLRLELGIVRPSCIVEHRRRPRNRHDERNSPPAQRSDDKLHRNDRLQLVEVEADKYMNELLRDLYGGKYDAIRAIVVRDVYELMEKVVDRCHDTGNVVMQIVLKNS